MIRDAAPSDEEFGALWTLIQSDFHANKGAIIATLDNAKALRPGLDATRATDIRWTLNHPDVWLLLVGERGWSPDEFESWLGETAPSTSCYDHADNNAPSIDARSRAPTRSTDPRAHAVRAVDAGLAARQTGRMSSPTRSRTFITTLQALPKGKARVPVPFDPNEVWGTQREHHVGGTIAAMPVRGTIVNDASGWSFSLGPA